MRPLRVHALPLGCALAFLLLAPEVHAGLPKPEDVKALRTQLAASRAALRDSGAQLEETDRELLSARLSAAEDALKRFVESENQHAKKNRLPPLYAAAGVLAADDATVVGAVDDVLLPFLGLAILVTHVAVMNAPTSAELETAWSDVVSRVEALSESAQKMSSRRKAGCACTCFKKGSGPLPMRRQSNPKACSDECLRIGYPGYQCGGGVTWN